MRTGIDKINSLKQIEQNKDRPAVKPAVKPAVQPAVQPQVKVQRSSSVKIPSRSAATLVRSGSQRQKDSKERNLTNIQTSNKKVTFNSEKSLSDKKSLIEAPSDTRSTPRSPKVVKKSVTSPK